jgi:hypothetical protein
MPKPFRGVAGTAEQRTEQYSLSQLDRSPILQLFHVKFLGLALGTRNNATQVSAEMADTPSVAESIPGKPGWLIQAIKRRFARYNASISRALLAAFHAALPRSS